MTNPEVGGAQQEEEARRLQTIRRDVAVGLDLDAPDAAFVLALVDAERARYTELVEAHREGLDLVSDAIELYKAHGRWPTAEIKWLEAARAALAHLEEAEA